MTKGFKPLFGQEKVVDCEEDNRNQQELQRIKQAAAEQLSASLVPHLALALMANGWVSTVTHTVFRADTRLTGLHSWLNVVIPALAAALSLVTTKVGLEDLWLKPAIMQRMILTKNIEANEHRSNDIVVCVTDKECEEYQIHFVDSPFSSGSNLSDRLYSPTPLNDEADTEAGTDIYREQMDATHFCTDLSGSNVSLSSHGSLGEGLLPARPNYVLVKQLLKQADGRSAYKASVMMLAATLLFVSLNLSDRLTPSLLAFTKGDTMASALSYTAQVIARFLSGVVFPALMATLGAPLADHSSLVTGMAVASMVGSKAAVLALSRAQVIDPYVNTLIMGLVAAAVAAVTLALDKHYQGKPSAAVNYGVNAFGSALGQAVTCGGSLDSRMCLPTTSKKVRSLEVS